MLSKRVLIATILIVGVCACDFEVWSNYDFETTAVYVAPKSSATAIVLTKGYVPQGEDLGDQNECVIDARITFSDKPTDVIKLSSNVRKVFSTSINGKTFPINDSMNYISVLIACCKQIGINNIDLEEIEEFGRVILSTGYGPKGTVLRGQSETILVDTVRYTTKDR